MNRSLWLLPILLCFNSFGQVQYVQRDISRDFATIDYTYNPQVVFEGGLTDYGISAMRSEKVSIPKAAGQTIPATYFTLPVMEPTKKYPLVIYLHGVGETVSLTSNIAGLLLQAEKRGFVVLAPQFIQGYNNWVPEWAGGVYVNTVVDWAIKNIPVIDTNQISITGISGGGGGCWDYITLKKEYCDKIAAVLPICGTGQSGVRDYSLPVKSKLPIWAFHAKDDKTVPVGATTGQIASVRSYTTSTDTLVNMTIYETGGHSIWGTVYGNNNVMDWFLRQKRNKLITPSPDPVPTKPKVLAIVHFGDGSSITIYDDKSFEFNY